VLPPGGYGDDDTDAQPFTVETLSTGDMVVLTNQELAVLRTIQRITDTTKFSPMFIDDLSMLLGSYMAGPVYKGRDRHQDFAGDVQGRACQDGPDSGRRREPAPLRSGG
jgi:hypothetical protein